MTAFSWDETKRLANLRKHGVDFEDVARIFDGPSIDVYDTEHSEGEDRWRRLTWLDHFVVVIIYTEEEDRVRLISARPGNDVETRIYFGEFFGEPLD